MNLQIKFKSQLTEKNLAKLLKNLAARKANPIQFKIHLNFQKKSNLKALNKKLRIKYRKKILTHINNQKAKDLIKIDKLKITVIKN